MNIEENSIKICNKKYTIIFSTEVKDDAMIDFDNCEIYINERLRNSNYISILERLFHEVMHGYENYFEVDDLFNVDSKQKEEILERIIQLAGKSFTTFISDNLEWMETLIKQIKKEQKNG